MDIGALSIEMHQSSLSQAVNIALLKKVMDTGEENSKTLIKDMQTLADPNLGRNIDVRV